VVTVYRTIPIVALPAIPDFDVAIFASPSAFQAFLAQNSLSSLNGKPIVAIGPTTAESIRSVGLCPLVASKPTIDVLVQTVALSWQQHGEP
jgi:uroporphyrinogen-III synthase